MAPTRTRGYTIIELMVVTLIIMLFAALVEPNFVNIRDNQKRRAFYASIVDLAGNAREMAITHNATVYLQADSGQSMIEIKQENDDTTFSPQDGNTGTPTTSAGAKTTAPQSNIGTSTNDRSGDPVMITLAVPAGISFGNFQLAGSPSDESSWKLRFFADGTADGGAVELNEKGVFKSLVVNPHAGVSLVDGNIPDSSNQSWPAGNYVQRQQ